MGALVPLGLSIAVLIALWTYVSLGVANLPVWAGIIAWGAFFAAGGKTAGLTKTLAATLSGVFWAFLALTIYTRMGGTDLVVLSLLVGVIGLIMVLQSALPALSFIPGAFLGAATTVGVVVGTKGTYLSTVIALVAGALLGYVSELLAAAVTARRQPTARPTA